MNEERYMDLQSWFLSQTCSQAPIWVPQISAHGMQPAIHRTFPSKEKCGSFRGIYNLEILCYLASQLLQIEWKILGKFGV